MINLKKFLCTTAVKSFLLLIVTVLLGIAFVRILSSIDFFYLGEYSRIIYAILYLSGIIVYHGNK